MPAVPSDDELETIRDWLESKRVANCGVCGAALAATGENTIHVFVPDRNGGVRLMRWGNPHSHRSRDLGSRLEALARSLRFFYFGSTQAVRIVCDNCGNIVLLDAKKVGVWPPNRETACEF